jgi:broad specificity phosphatase PhoE
MAPTLHLVRHAQGLHNISVENEKFPDPSLTEVGIEQCAALRANFTLHDQVAALVASPLSRTIQTCVEAFGTEPLASTPSGKLSKIILVPTLQEVSDSPCDTGSDREHVEKTFGKIADLSRVPEGWNDKLNDTEWEPTLEKLQARAVKARNTLREICNQAGPDAHIVVVSHGAFLHILTDDFFGIDPDRGISSPFKKPPHHLPMMP